VRYYQLTGDRALLEDLYPAALRNMSAFERFLTKDGLIDGAGWAFVDWGYVRNPGPADMGYNLHFLTAVRAMSDWSRLLGKQNDEARFVAMDQQVSRVVRAWLDGNLADGSSGWQRIGYHCTVLALWLGLIPPEKEAECLQAIRGHILRCFPNDPEAPRLSDPQITNQRIITPYFAHFAFPPLIERGGMDFVLDQYRKCWGWLLGDGRTTWLEVFDPRWSHCHHWSGPPTWQLSRYVLGLNPRFDLGKNHYEFNFHPGPLPTAKGRLPFPDGSGHISVEWRRDTSRIQYQLAADSPITLLMPAVKPGEHPSVVEIKDRYEMVLPPSLQ